MVYTTRFSGGKGGRNGLEPNCAAWASRRKTASRTTPRPRAKSSGSSRPSRNGWPPSTPPATLTQLQAHLDAFTASTTTSGRTAPCPTGPPPPPPTPPGPKPPPATAPPTPTTGSAPTARRQRHRHPPPRRQALPHRHRPDPRPDLRPAPGPGPAHPRHQRRHRRTPPRTQPRHHPQLPAHRPATRPPTRNTPQTGKTPNPNVGSGSFRCLARSHWSPLTESNRRPSPYHGPPDGPCKRRRGSEQAGH